MEVQMKENREEKETKTKRCYLQGLEALHEGLGFVFVLFCFIRIGTRRRLQPGGVWLRLSRWLRLLGGAVLFWAIVLLLHFL